MSSNFMSTFSLAKLKLSSLTCFGRMLRYAGAPVPAGIILPMMIFSFKPCKWSTLPFNAASVNTLLDSWKDAADKKLSVVKLAFVIP